LAPHFNVNLGNANNGEVQSEENVITGAVVGGIVDIRGNAQVYGTVIPWSDTASGAAGTLPISARRWGTAARKRRPLKISQD
jgi:hypothetical protein